jgi:hypothetical protein
LERVDVVLRVRLIDALLDHCAVKAIAKPARGPFESLKYDANLAVSGTRRLSLPLCTDVDEGNGQQDKNRNYTF